MVPRQFVMKMSSGSSRPYEQAPERTSSVISFVYCQELARQHTCTHALLALLQLGEELEVPGNLRDRHGVWTGCGSCWVV